MGIVERKNEHLDPQRDESGRLVNAMNDRHFRELCVPIGNKNYAMKLKTKPDIEPINYLRCEWIAEQLNIEEDLAMQVVDTFKDLRLNRKTVMQIFYLSSPFCWKGTSYVKQFGKDKGSVVEVPHSTSKEIARDIEILRELDLGASEPVASIWGDTSGEPISDDWIYMTDEVIDVMENKRYNEETNGCFEDYMDVTSPAYPYALFPLCYGNEALSHEFIQMIKDANEQKIKEIQSRFYPQYSPMTGRTRAPEYWYLTPSQKSQAWIYIKARKKQLEIKAEQNISEDFKKCEHWINQYGKSQISTGLIFAFKEGREFDMFGEKIKFDSAGSPHEVSKLWMQYNVK
jgi:hypothetical protein